MNNIDLKDVNVHFQEIQIDASFLSNVEGITASNIKLEDGDLDHPSVTEPTGLAII